MHWARWGDPAAVRPLADSARDLVELAFGPAAEQATTPLPDVRLPEPGLDAALLEPVGDLEDEPLPVADGGVGEVADEEGAPEGEVLDGAVDLHPAVLPADGLQDPELAGCLATFEFHGALPGDAAETQATGSGDAHAPVVPPAGG